MRLTPKESDRLELFVAAELARRRRARGRRLNVPEAIALISDELIERAWDGEALDAVIAAGRSLLTSADVMDGVAVILRHIEIDCLFPSGSTLVVIEDPIRQDADAGGEREPRPGSIATRSEPIEINSGRTTLILHVTNRSDRPIFVSSHFPFAQVNEALEFPRELALGMRLDIAAGSSLLFEPERPTTVRLVSFGGLGRSPSLRLGSEAGPHGNVADG